LNEKLISNFRQLWRQNGCADFCIGGLILSVIHGNWAALLPFRIWWEKLAKIRGKNLRRDFVGAGAKFVDFGDRIVVESASSIAVDLPIRLLAGGNGSADGGHGGVDSLAAGSSHLAEG